MELLCCDLTSSRLVLASATQRAKCAVAVVFKSLDCGLWTIDPSKTRERSGRLLGLRKPSRRNPPQQTRDVPPLPPRKSPGPGPGRGALSPALVALPACRVSAARLCCVPLLGPLEAPGESLCSVSSAVTQRAADAKDRS